MSNQLTAVVNNTVTVWDDKAKLTEIKKVFAPTLSDLEFSAFIGMGKATKLNPYLKQIWAVKYDTRSPAQIFIGRDGYREAAQRNPEYDIHQGDAVYENDSFKVTNGEVEHTYTLKDRGALVGAYCTAKRKSSTRPFYVFVELKEYNTGRSLWREKPATMIKKVAEAQALRGAFQELFAGTYSDAEIGDTSSQTERLKERVINKQPEVVDAETGEVIEHEAKPKNPAMVDNPSDTEPATDEQVNAILVGMAEAKFDTERREKAFAYYKIEKLADLTQSKANSFLEYLEK